MPPKDLEDLKTNVDRIVSETGDSEASKMIAGWTLVATGVSINLKRIENLSDPELGLTDAEAKLAREYTSKAFDRLKV